MKHKQQSKLDYIYEKYRLFYFDVIYNYELNQTLLFVVVLDSNHV